MKLSHTPSHQAPTRARAGLSVIEIMVAMTVLGIVIALAGRLTFAVTQYGRLNDLKTKRSYAMAQQTNFVGALPYASLTPSLLPATKTFTTGDFSYTRRVAVAAGVNSKTIVITIVPNTAFPNDTLHKETATIVRTVPPCGTVLNNQSC
jgi:prepilin-type N-terminal cleavage/methylation domain-containing protein